MRLPPAPASKTPHNRHALTSLQAHPVRGQQSHSSSFIADQKIASMASHGQDSRDSKDNNSNVLILAADDNVDDKSVTVTTCHNGNIGVDGAFQEEDEDDAGLG